MKTKQFEYITKDIDLLKRDMALRLVYFLLFTLICVWQVVSIFVYSSKFTPVHYVVSCFVAVVSLLLALVSIWYATNDIASINTIKRNGHHVKSTPMMFGSGKSSWFKIYYFASKLFALIMVAVALSAITYNILQYIYYQTFSLYIPAIMLLTVVSFHGVFQADAERRIEENVKEFNEL